MVLHGDISATESRYDPLTKEQIKESGIDYLALGHTHQFGGFLREGQTTYAYSGCPEGRGFDELGEKGILTGTVERGKAELSFVPFARRRYEVLNVDVTGRSAEDALRAALPNATVRDIYRIIFTGETDERGLDLKSIEEQFAPDFFHLELRDETRIGEDVWARAQEDSLRGLFLRELRTKFDVASSDDERRSASPRASALLRSTGVICEEENYVDLVQPAEKGRKIPAPRGGGEVRVLLCRASLQRTQPYARCGRRGGESAPPLSQN